MLLRSSSALRLRSTAVRESIPQTRNRVTSIPTTSVSRRRVAAYARVSTDSDEQYTSYEAQVDYFTNFIQARSDWDFMGVYTDEGITGTSTKHREGFKRMVSDAMDGKIDLIVTKSVSRFARNTVDSLTTVRQLKERGVEVFFQKENIYTFDGKGELLITMLDAIFHPEDDMLSFRWESNGAYPTYKSFCSLVKEKQEALLDFLSGLSLETDINCNGQSYRLVHAAPAYMFAGYNHRNWDETTFCVWYRIRIEDTISADETLIFGHTPTYRYSHGLPVSIWRGQNRIDIDCGAGHGYGGRLACLRLDDMAEFYVDA